MHRELTHDRLLEILPVCDVIMQPTYNGRCIAMESTCHKDTQNMQCSQLKTSALRVWSLRQTVYAVSESELEVQRVCAMYNQKLTMS